jgi:hypothetical protein
MNVAFSFCSSLPKFAKTIKSDFRSNFFVRNFFVCYWRLFVGALQSFGRRAPIQRTPEYEIEKIQENSTVSFRDLDLRY